MKYTKRSTLLADSDAPQEHLLSIERVRCQHPRPDVVDRERIDFTTDIVFAYSDGTNAIAVREEGNLGVAWKGMTMVERVPTDRMYARASYNHETGELVYELYDVPEKVATVGRDEREYRTEVLLDRPNDADLDGTDAIVEHLNGQLDDRLG